RNTQYAIRDLLAALGERARCDEPLKRHTTIRIGGPADLYVEASTARELADLVLLARQHHVPHLVMGSGSNMLVSDAGLRGLVIANRARRIEFQVEGSSFQADKDNGLVELEPETFKLQAETILAWAESGVTLPSLALACIERGYANLEWAAGVPGTVGGAVVGNAGAHGGDVACDLVTATILNGDGVARDWSNEELGFGYRTSRLKIANRKSQTPALALERSAGASVAICRPVVLAAAFRLRTSTREELEARVADFAGRRRRRQPPGATMGSVFKNPTGDYAGRLLEAAGLKGSQVGQAQISPAHANFIVNLGDATAADVKALIDLARDKVRAQFGVELELEIELIGE
ncbi:MAG: UDP-N-acetylmuramate dehydrogenase, partial [Thermoflexales bacterium]|nr:UDP-N-acetylmuramate dehydrogenase [Thermoflexales bacterium]